MKISKEQMEAGLEMAKRISGCPGNDCFWRERGGEKAGCALFAFRESFKRDSPLLFNESLKFSEYKKIIYKFELSELGVLDSEAVKRAQTELHDLNLFTQTLVLAFFPLYLANNEEIPPLSYREIRRAEKTFSSKPHQTARRTRRKMARLNSEWAALLVLHLNNLKGPNRRSYVGAIILLVELFLRGAERKEIFRKNSEGD